MINIITQNKQESLEEHSWMLKLKDNTEILDLWKNDTSLSSVL